MENAEIAAGDTIIEQVLPLGPLFRERILAENTFAALVFNGKFPSSRRAPCRRQAASFDPIASRFHVPSADSAQPAPYDPTTSPRQNGSSPPVTIARCAPGKTGPTAPPLDKITPSRPSRGAEADPSLAPLFRMLYERLGAIAHDDHEPIRKEGFVQRKA